MKKCVNTCADNDGGQKPRHHWTAFLRAGASYSTGIPKKPAIDFQHSSGGALSKSEPRACSASCSTFASAIASRASCGKTTCGFGFGNGRACSVCVSPASNQTNSQIRQTSTLIPLLLSRATSNIAFPHDGQGRALLPSWWIACNQNGLIDSGVKVRRSKCRPTARPSHFSQRQMTPLPVRNSVNGIRQAGQRSSASTRNDVADQVCSR